MAVISVSEFLDCHQPKMIAPVHMLVAEISPPADKHQFSLFQKKIVQLAGNVDGIVAGQVGQKCFQIDLLKMIDKYKPSTVNYLVTILRKEK